MTVNGGGVDVTVSPAAEGFALMPGRQLSRMSALVSVDAVQA